MSNGLVPLLLFTKLHRPAVSDDYVPRPRLIERLTRNPNRMLTLVAAPAGFGKTTLVSAWLSASKKPSAWLSVDENDNTLPIFMGYLVAAVQSIFADALAETEALLHAPHLATAEVLIITFINEVARLPDDFILALDDYHFIHDEDIHQFVIRLIRQRPRRLHLVLITRISPPFPLSTMRTAPLRILELRMRDLRFTTEELHEFAARAMNEQLNESALSILEERTEGWAAGLRLAFLSLQNHPDPQALLDDFQGASADVMNYLMDQVISQQPAGIVDMLLRTSILDRFCAPLCDVLLDSHTGIDTSTFLSWIERTNLFVTPVNEKFKWLRYDHLFRELLLNRLHMQLDPGDIAMLHVRASDWFAANDLVDEAVQHALASNDAARAAQAVERNVTKALAREDRLTLDRWLRALPMDVKQTRPALLVAQAWLRHFQGDTLTIDRLLKIIDAALENGDHDLAGDVLHWAQGSVAALWGEHWFVGNELELAVEHCRRALAVLPPVAFFERRTAVAYLCFARQAAGQIEEAEQLVAGELERSEAQTDAPAGQLYLVLCWIQLLTGDLQQLEQLAQHFLKQTQRRHLLHSQTWAHYFLGLLHYEWNDLEASIEHFRAVAERRYSAHFTTAQESLLGMALIREAQGSPEEAHETTEALAAFNLERAGVISGKTQSAQARLAVTQGDTEGAASLVRNIVPAIPDRPIPLIDEPSTTLARVLIAEQTDDSLLKAKALLDDIHQLAFNSHNARRLIEVLALQALALQALGQKDAALDALQQAVALAQPGGFIRMFVDLGPSIQSLLGSLAKRGIMPNYLRRLLAAFALVDAENGSGHHDDVDSPTPNTNSAGMTSASILLTPRELEVLNLLDSPLSDKEIALKLFITVNTVKRHTGSIYQKLGVHSRRRAVARAKGLRILLSPAV